MAQNEAGWWYVAGGLVDFNYNGIGSNEAGWWKFTNGQVDFGFNGMAGNAAGWWKFSGGKIDFTFNGIAPNESGSWYFRGGQLQFGYSGTVQWMGLNCTISGGKLVPVGISGAIASRAASAKSDTNWLIVTDTNAAELLYFTVRTAVGQQ